MNRLDLDFTIESNEGRAAYVTQYLEKEFPSTGQKKLTERELQTIADYIIYGKDKDGTSSTDRGEIQINTKYSTWAPKREESLDALIESPTFNENQISDGRTHYRTPKVTFSREENAHIPELIPVWREIDTLELKLNFYDFKSGKRKNPPRKELTDRFTPEEVESIKASAENLEAFKVYKMRHLLVELRREQYTIRDAYVAPVVMNGSRTPTRAEERLTFDFSIPVLPLGLFYQNHFSERIFTNEIGKDLFERDFQKEVSLFLHYRKNLLQDSQGLQAFDFSNPEHIANLILFQNDLNDVQVDSESTILDFLRTVDFYISLADLSPIHQRILELKRNHIKNEDISFFINKDFGKSYTPNYISTIFRQKICPAIADAAALHLQIIENLFDANRFKKCNTCGRILLRSSENFVKKSRSSDGFSNRCKKCDKEERKSKKEVKV